ncbi:MAG: hypothetical protein QXV32_04345 [Conexivisphaerales archaeon]
MQKVIIFTFNLTSKTKGEHGKGRDGQREERMKNNGAQSCST